VLFRKFGSRAWNDLWLARRAKLTPGKQVIGDRVAIYVIYAPSGIQPSHLAALQSIASAGYSAVVVSNTPL